MPSRSRITCVTFANGVVMKSRAFGAFGCFRRRTRPRGCSQRFGDGRAGCVTRRRRRDLGWSSVSATSGVTARCRHRTPAFASAVIRTRRECGIFRKPKRRRLPALAASFSWLISSGFSGCVAFADGTRRRAGRRAAAAADAARARAAKENARSAHDSAVLLVVEDLPERPRAPRRRPRPEPGPEPRRDARAGPGFGNIRSRDSTVAMRHECVKLGLTPARTSGATPARLRPSAPHRSFSREAPCQAFSFARTSCCLALRAHADPDQEMREACCRGRRSSARWSTTPTN